MRVRRWTGGIAVVITLVASAMAVAATEPTYNQTLLALKPKTPTSTSVSLRVSDPEDGRPASYSKIELKWPSGAVIDTGAAPFCKKMPCPGKTRVGGGDVTIPARRSDDDDILGGVNLYNKKGGLFVEVEFEDGLNPIPATFSAKWSGKRSRHPSDKPGVRNVYASPTLTITTVPFCYSPGVFNSATQQCEANGQPSREAVIRDYSLSAFFPVKKAKRQYQRTPSKCTPSKGWTFVGTFTPRGVEPPRSLKSKADCVK